MAICAKKLLTGVVDSVCKRYRGGGEIGGRKGLLTLLGGERDLDYWAKNRGGGVEFRI